MASNSINILINAKDNASAVLGRVTDAAVTAAKVGMVAFAGGVTAAGVAGFKFNSSVEQAQATINAFTKDAGKTAEILDQVKQESIKTQFSFTDMANAAASLIPASKQSGASLNDLIKQAEILAALNPAEGLVGAAFSLKEALSGDFVSIVERFNLPRQRLNELKAQGVPALQAIQTALKEMGIDYDLVTKQGQTTAARWNTMKDQFTQLAGAVSKPIFDIVSRGLSKLSESIDWEQWSQRGTAAVERVVDMAKTFRTGVSAMFEAMKGEGVTSKGFVGVMERIGVIFRLIGETLKNYLGPSIEALGGTFKKDMLPTLKLMVPYLDDIAKIIGGVLVAAIWLFINALRIQMKLWSEMWQAFFAVKNAIGTTVDWIATKFRELKDVVSNLWNGMVEAATAAWQAVYNVAIKPVIELISAHIRVIGAVVEYVWGWVNALTMVAWNAIYNNMVKPTLDLIAAGMNWVGGVIAAVWSWVTGVARAAWNDVANAATSAWGWIVGVWQSAVGWFQGIWNRISGAASGPANAIKSTFSGVMEDIKGVVKGAVNWIIDTINSMIGKVNSVASKVPGAPKLGTIPRFALGTNYAPGGMALVGENGPEIVNLPRGSQVVPNYRTQEVMRGGSGGVVIENLNVNNNVDVNRVVRHIGWRLATA